MGAFLSSTQENPFINLKTQVYLTFAVSFLLAPFNAQFLTLLIGILFIEFAIFSYERYMGRTWNYTLRIMVVLASLLGWTMGKLVLWTTTLVKIWSRVEIELI